MSDRKIVDYKILNAPSMVEIENSIKDYIESGYYPIGNISIENFTLENEDEIKSWFYQAMVKYED